MVYPRWYDKLKRNIALGFKQSNNDAMRDVAAIKGFIQILKNGISDNDILDISKNV